MFWTGGSGVIYTLYVFFHILYCVVVAWSLPLSVLGMNLFGGKFSTNVETGLTCSCDEILNNTITCQQERKNFDSLLWSLVTVFQVMYEISLLYFHFCSLLYVILHLIDTNDYKSRQCKKFCLDLTVYKAVFKSHFVNRLIIRHLIVVKKSEVN